MEERAVCKQLRLSVPAAPTLLNILVTFHREDKFFKLQVAIVIYICSFIYEIRFTLFI